MCVVVLARIPIPDRSGRVRNSTDRSNSTIENVRRIGCFALQNVFSDQSNTAKYYKHEQCTTKVLNWTFYEWKGK